MSDIPLSRCGEPARHALEWAFDGIQKLFSIPSWRYSLIAALSTLPFFLSLALIAFSPAQFAPRKAMGLLAAGLFLSAILTPAVHTAICLAAQSARRGGPLSLAFFAPAFADARLGKALCLGVILVFFQLLGAAPLALFLAQGWIESGSQMDLAALYFFGHFTKSASLIFFALASWVFGAALLWLAPALLAREAAAPLHALLRASLHAFWRNQSACALLVSLLAAEAVALSLGLFFFGFLVDAMLADGAGVHALKTTATQSASFLGFEWGGRGKSMALLTTLAVFSFWRSAMALSCDAARQDLIVWLPQARVRSLSQWENGTGIVAFFRFRPRRSPRSLPMRVLCAPGVAGQPALTPPVCANNAPAGSPSGSVSPAGAEAPDPQGPTNA